MVESIIVQPDVHGYNGVDSFDDPNDEALGNPQDMIRANNTPDEDVELLEKSFSMDLSIHTLIEKLNCIYVSGEHPVVGTLYVFDTSICFYSLLDCGLSENLGKSSLFSGCKS